MGSSGFSWKLADHPKLPKGKTVAVVVLDGWGEAKPDKYNCIHVAETPTMDSLRQVLVLQLICRFCALRINLSWRYEFIKCPVML